MIIATVVIFLFPAVDISCWDDDDDDVIFNYEKNI
jgi:hypothetical protein